MEKLTKALMTDETGQAIVAKLTALSGQMHELAMATRGSAILFESESDISVLGDGGYLAVYVGSTNPLVISSWTGDNSLATGRLYYLIKSGTAVASSDLGEYGGTAVTDTTLELPNVPADSETAGKALTALDTRVTAVEDDILELQDGGYVADQQKIAEKINDWLEEHPEATTTVQDGSLTEAKFSNALKLKAIKDYVTPEMFGAVGDGVTDDSYAIESCLDSGVQHIVMSKNYYVSRPITNIHNNVFIDGNGTIIAETTGFEIDGARGWIIKDLLINFKTYGIHVKSTKSYVQYSECQNLILNGSDSDSIGVYLERTTSHLNELRFTNVVCWGIKSGFVVYNPDTTTECAGHRFLFCSAETATDYGWSLTNSDSVSLIFSRTEEAYGRRIETKGECNRIVIVTTKLIFQSEQPFSNNTNGVILGCVRSGNIYDTTFGGYARIVNGKVIPCNAFFSGFNTESINTDKSYPFKGGTTIYCTNTWHKYSSSESTLTLDDTYYGGHGLINDLYIVMGSGAGAITVINGDITFTIPSASSKKIYHFMFLRINNNRTWEYTEMLTL